MSDEINIVFMKCPNCAADLEIAPGSESGKCDYCGSSFMVTKPKADKKKKKKSEKIKYNKDWARKLSKIIIKRFKKEKGIDLSQDETAFKRINESTAKLAAELETEPTGEINIPFISSDSGGPLHVKYTFSREEAEKK
jgi:primosomal protein N'